MLAALVMATLPATSNAGLLGSLAEGYIIVHTAGPMKQLDSWVSDPNADMAPVVPVTEKEKKEAEAKKKALF